MPVNRVEAVKKLKEKRDEFVRSMENRMHDTIKDFEENTRKVLNLFAKISQEPIDTLAKQGGSNLTDLQELTYASVIEMITTESKAADKHLSRFSLYAGAAFDDLRGQLGNACSRLSGEFGKVTQREYNFCCCNIIDKRVQASISSGCIGKKGSTDANTSRVARD